MSPRRPFAIAFVALLCLPGGAGHAGDPDNTPGLRAAYAGPPATWPLPQIDSDVAFVEMAALPLPPPPGPEAELGARLSADPRLSMDGRVACLSCHDPAHGFTVPDRVGRGIQGTPGRRNPPSLLLVATRSWLDWDGRETDLSARVLAPLHDPTEMGTDLKSAVERLAQTEMTETFHAVFGEEGVSIQTLARALASYVTEVVPENRTGS